MVRFEEMGGAEEASREATPSQVARLLIADDHALVRGEALEPCSLAKTVSKL